MTIQKKGGRFITKKTNKSGEVPTIPKSGGNHVTGQWISTDIYSGEIYINTTDNRIWFRNDNNEIIEIPTLQNNKLQNTHLPEYFGLNYIGMFNNIVTDNPQKGDYYIIKDSIVIGGIQYYIGDFIIYNGQSWDKKDNTNKIINATDITYDNKSLKDIIKYLLSEVNLNKSLKIKEEIILTNKDSDDVLFQINKNTLKYKGIDILHKGNSNKQDIDWYSNIHYTNEVKAKNITSKSGAIESLKSKKIESNSIKSTSFSTKIHKTEKLSVKNGIIEFTNRTNYISLDGKGLSIVHSSNNILNYKASDNKIHLNSPLSYNDGVIINSDSDIVNKKYVDDKFSSTLSLNVTSLSDNALMVEKHIRHINVDINRNSEYNILVDNLENIGGESFMLIIDINSPSLLFKVNIKSMLSSNGVIYTTNRQELIGLYYNSKHNKWTKAF